MTGGSPAGPRTEAGQRLVNTLMDDGWPSSLDDAIVAIESEAASLAAPPDLDVTDHDAVTERLRTDATARYFYELGRLGPRRVAAPPVGAYESALPLDVERLEHCLRLVGYKALGWLGYHEATKQIAAEYARLSLKTVVGNGDGTVTVTLDDGTERRITEVEYLAWPRRSVEEPPDD